MPLTIRALQDRLSGDLRARWGAVMGLLTTALGLGVLAYRAVKGVPGSPNAPMIFTMIAVQVVTAAAVGIGSRLGWIVGQYSCLVAAIYNIVQFYRARNAGRLDPNFGDEPFNVAFFLWFAGLGALMYLGTPSSRPAPHAAAPSPGPSPDLAPAGAVRPHVKQGDPIEWMRDNVEAIAVAFLMALIIRCFCVEVFKIPTGSMEPTLYGDTKPGEPPPAHQGDRIMVDKIGLVFSGVRRYDVCVFKYPLDRSRNFIKRIVGLPEEDLRVDHGDIWTRPHAGGDGKFRVARKPEREQAGIWLHAWPGDDVSAEKCRKEWDGAPAACYGDGAVFDTGPAKGEATFRKQSPVKDWYRGKGTNGRVNDLAMRFKAAMSAGSELFVTYARSDGYGRFTTRIAANGTVSFAHLPDAGGTFEPLPVPQPATQGAVADGAEVEVAQWDGAVHVRIAGREVAVWEYLDVLPEKLRMPDAPPFQVMFGSRGGAVRFEKVWLGRDILYNETGQNAGESVLTGQPFLSIPKDRYFAIGDNVCNSKDGRLWKERILRLKNGLVMHGDGDSPENYPQNRAEEGGMERFRDLDGTDHWFRREDVEDEGDLEKPWHPFVAREEMVGKALVVWWPMERFKRIR